MSDSEIYYTLEDLATKIDELKTVIGGDPANPNVPSLNDLLKELNEQRIGDIATPDTLNYLVNQLNSKLDTTNNKLGDALTDDTVIYELNQTVNKLIELSGKLGDELTDNTVIFELNQTVAELQNTVSELQTLNSKIGDVATANTVLERLNTLVDKLTTVINKLGDNLTDNTVIYELDQTVSKLSSTITELQSLNSKIGDTATAGTTNYLLNELNNKIGSTTTPNTVLERLQKVIDQIGDEATAGTLIYGIKDLRDKIGDTATTGTTNYLLNQLNNRIGDETTPNTLNYNIKKLTDALRSVGADSIEISMSDPYMDHITITPNTWGTVVWSSVVQPLWKVFMHRVEGFVRGLYIQCRNTGIVDDTLTFEFYDVIKGNLLYTAQLSLPTGSTEANRYIQLGFWNYSPTLAIRITSQNGVAQVKLWSSGPPDTFAEDINTGEVDIYTGYILDLSLEVLTFTKPSVAISGFVSALSMGWDSINGKPTILATTPDGKVLAVWG